MKFIKRNVRLLPQDSDAFGVINWGTYARYCEEGELGFMEMMGFSFIYFYKKQNVFFPRRAVNFEYLSQTTLENIVDIETEVRHIGTTSFTLVHHFYKKTSEDSARILAAKAEVTEVAYSATLHSKVPLPEELVVALKRCLQP